MRRESAAGVRGWESLGVALAAIALVAVLGTIVLTPTFGLPVGTGTTYGDSMGADGEQAVVYTTLVEPDVGDEVVFDAGGRYGATHHRIVAETSEGFVTKGDAVDRVDQNEAPGAMPYVTDENLHGVVVASAPLALVKGGLLALLAALFAVAFTLRRRQFVAERSRA